MSAPATALSLYELTGLVRSVLEQTMDDEYWLEAEISEARVAANGHFYVEFVQKDATGRNFVAKARGTMWNRTYNMLAPLFERATGERLRAGLQVRVLVTVAFHEVYGFSLNIINIDPDYTLGDMARRRREILAQLEADGILKDNQMLPLPLSLKRVAVISSTTAAGYGDFCNQLQSNAEGLYFETRLFPAMMQGSQVESSVLAALAAVCDEADHWDCVVIIRGGGATSDLSDFDTYTLAAAVAQMPLPVIVGIGHERDETVLDFVAHTRVKTPTAAAVFLIEHQARQLTLVINFSERIKQQAAALIHQASTDLERLTAQLPRSFSLVNERQGRLIDALSVRLAQVVMQRLVESDHQLERHASAFAQAATLQLHHRRAALDLLEQRLQALDPVAQLKRGYSLTYTSDGKLVKRPSDVCPGQQLMTQLATGCVTSEVLTTQKKRK